MERVRAKNIKIEIQSNEENQRDFIQRLEKQCKDIANQFIDELENSPIVFLTITNIGTLTATIHYTTLLKKPTTK